jgi:hypothetical protein
MSATPDSTLADSEQLIANLHRQLAECRAERDEALQRETATTEVLQVINSSPGDLAPVFDAILEKTHTLGGAPLGSLVLWDGEQLRAVATRGYPQEYNAIARQGFSPTPPFRRLRVTPQPESRELIATWAPGRGIEKYVISAIVEGRKPSAP